MVEKVARVAGQRRQTWRFLLQAVTNWQVVQNTRSKSQMGETINDDLYKIFQQDYRPVGSPCFEGACENFIISSAGYDPVLAGLTVAFSPTAASISMKSDYKTS
ncbi:unnamed protein product [Ilex paraguariensis]|uniref:Uncharacterized protein n=1 Tax=Ilex paraguariensis TaxID=185542 RepID=A0ABC8RZ01_9AQUA